MHEPYNRTENKNMLVDIIKLIYKIQTHWRKTPSASFIYGRISNPFKGHTEIKIRVRVAQGKPQKKFFFVARPLRGGEQGPGH